MSERIMTHNWLWFDIETTGLDEGAGHILEVGAAIVDDGPDGTFEIIDQADTVVLPPCEMSELQMDEYVRGMHTKNGLLALVAQGRGMALGDADDMLRQFCDHVCPDQKLKMVLAGGSVHFDLRWSRKHLPRFTERLSHRVFDVSTLKAAARVWGPGFEDIKSDKHRAMYDVGASVKEAKAYLDLIRG